MSKLLKLIELINLRQMNYQLKKEKIMDRNEKLKRLSIMEAKAKGRNELLFVSLGDAVLYKIKNNARKKYFRRKIQEVK